MSDALMGYKATKNDDPLKRSVDRKNALQDKIRSGEMLRNIKTNPGPPTQTTGANG